MKRLLVNVALILVLPLVVTAIEPRKQQLIDQVIEVMHLRTGLEFQRGQNIDVMRKLLEQQAGATARNIYSVLLRERAMEKYADYTKELFSWYTWEKRYVAYYDKAFSEAQLKELLAFLKTGTGQAMMRSQGELALQVQKQLVEMADETNRWRERMIKETIEEVGRDVEIVNKNLHAASPVELEKAAREGYPVAQYLLGSAYREGKGVEKDLGTAVRWFRVAADQGDGPALGIMGASYYKGEGVEQDLAQARAYFKKSAEAGNMMGAYSVGYLYLLGEGVGKDTKEAFRWLLQAANGGHGPAQSEIARLYWNGDGVEQNLIESYAWILVAEDLAVDGIDEFKKFASPRLNSDQVADAMMRSSEIRRAIKALYKAR